MSKMKNLAKLLFARAAFITVLAIGLSSCGQPTDGPSQYIEIIESMISVPNAQFYLANEADWFSPYFLDENGILIPVSFIDSEGNTVVDTSLWALTQISVNEFYMDTVGYGDGYIFSIADGTLKKLNSPIYYDSTTEYPVIKRNNEIYWTDGSYIYKRNITSGAESTVAAQSGAFGSDPAFYITGNGHIVTQGKLYPSDGGVPVSTGILLNKYSVVYFYGPDNTLYVHYDEAPRYVLKSIEYTNDSPDISTIKNESPGFAVDSGSPIRHNHPFSGKQTYENSNDSDGYVAIEFSGNLPVVSYKSYSSSLEFDISDFFYEWHIASGGSTSLGVREANSSDSYVQTIDTTSVIQYEICGALVLYEKFVSGTTKKWYYKSILSNVERELPIYIDPSYGLTYMELGNM